jgi:hypothetical protein
MRDDLLDAQATIDWSITQIPLLQVAFVDWHRANPYRVVQEHDPEGAGDIAVVYDQSFPLTFNVWVGAIINSLRSGLDLLAAALAARNSINPSADTHFPVFRSLHDLIDPLTGIEGKKWLSQWERATIKALNPYRGGDAALWTLHQLDILRKHERLISARPDINGYLMIGSRVALNLQIPKAVGRFENKTILCRLDPGEVLDATQGNTLLSFGVVFNETALDVADHQVSKTLLGFAERVAEIIGLFDTP